MACLESPVHLGEERYHVYTWGRLFSDEGLKRAPCRRSSSRNPASSNPEYCCLQKREGARPRACRAVFLRKDPTQRENRDVQLSWQPHPTCWGRCLPPFCLHLATPGNADSSLVPFPSLSLHYWLHTLLCPPHTQSEAKPFAMVFLERGKAICNGFFEQRL